MFTLVSRLVLYSDLSHDSILADMARIYREWQTSPELNVCTRADLLTQTNAVVKRLLDISTTYGFDSDLWCDYLAFELLTCENSFSLSMEGRDSIGSGTVNDLAQSDFGIFFDLLHWDFRPLEEALQTNILSTLRNYHAIKKQKRNYYANISAKVRKLSAGLSEATDANAIFSLVLRAYSSFGVGLFGLNGAFRISRGQNYVEQDSYVQNSPNKNLLHFVPINNASSVRLNNLTGYELQKEQLIANTEAFVKGFPANNVLLYGDAGTGKSTSVKALIDLYYDRGLRMIEIYKYQFRELSLVIEAIKHRNYHFIIFIDDLSFEENEVEYKFLKAVIEGGVESRPENVLIYATSNRRHLIHETWSDRDDIELDGDIHRSDTVEEKLSLAGRFGVTINYSSPTPDLFHQIVLELAVRELPAHAYVEENLLKLADRWGIRHGGISGRTAQQFIDHLAGVGPRAN